MICSIIDLKKVKKVNKPDVDYVFLGFIDHKNKMAEYKFIKITPEKVKLVKYIDEVGYKYREETNRFKKLFLT